MVEHAVRPLEIAVLGLAYEPHSDDVRAAPSLALVLELRAIAHMITAWDPLLPEDVVGEIFPFVRQVSSPTDAVRDADVVLVLTSYPEVVDTRWVAAPKRQPEPVIVVDAADCMDQTAVARRGVVYGALGAPKRIAAYRETLPPVGGHAVRT